MKNIFIYTIFLIVPVVLNSAPDQSNGGINGYNSLDAGLEQTDSMAADQKIYSILQIDALRKGVPPRYVRVLSFGDSSKKGKILKNGILFTSASFKSRRVTLSGNFNNWNHILMKRGKYGVFYYILPVQETQSGSKMMNYEYKFQVDGIWEHDPENKNVVDDGLGTYSSVFILPAFDPDKRVAARVLRTKISEREKLVEFAIYMPNGQNLSLVGDFNNWNPEMDPLVKGSDDVFRLRKRFRPGTYYYKYVVDGKWILDSFNPETRYHKDLEELTSMIKIED